MARSHKFVSTFLNPHSLRSWDNILAFVSEKNFSLSYCPALEGCVHIIILDSIVVTGHRGCNPISHLHKKHIIWLILAKPPSSSPPFSQSSKKGKDHLTKIKKYMDVSENSGTPKLSILIRFSIINHPFWGTPIFGNTHIGVWKGLAETVNFRTSSRYEAKVYGPSTS